MNLQDLQRAAHGEPQAVAAVVDALKRGATGELAAVTELPAFDAARLILQLKPKRARKLLDMLPDAPSLALVTELDPWISEHLLDEKLQKRISRIAARLPVEDAADFLADTPEELKARALAEHPQEAALRTALDFREETAGAIMQRRLVAVPIEMNVGEAVAEIRARAGRIARLYTVYVVDGERRLLGHLKLRDLLLNTPDTPVRDLVRTDAIAVSADTDREEVARLAERTDLPVVPVVDADGRLLGVVTTEDLLETEREEAVEDMMLMSGLDPDTSPADGPFQIVPRRLPWLATGLVGAGTAAVVVGSYEDALAEAAILATLIPIVMSLAGNAGIQASTVTVQALASGNYWVGDIVGRTLREFGGALLNGALVGLLVTAGIFAMSALVEIPHPATLALTAALTLVVVTVQASVIGSLVPVLLQRLKFDPAVATGVFITTSNDVIGVLIFFLIATSLYL
ncbi:MAG: magnesium transporter [Sneathiellaceae bacterium]